MFILKWESEKIFDKWAKWKMLYLTHFIDYNIRIKCIQKIFKNIDYVNIKYVSYQLFTW